jgi:hypothetical protein
VDLKIGRVALRATTFPQKFSFKTHLFLQTFYKI